MLGLLDGPTDVPGLVAIVVPVPELLCAEVPGPRTIAPSGNTVTLVGALFVLLPLVGVGIGVLVGD